MGHPGCSRFVQGLVVRQPGGAPVFHPLVRWDDARDRETIAGFLDRFGGLTFRLDTPTRAVVRAFGVLVTAPYFFARRVIPFVMRLTRRLDPEHPARLAWRWLRATVRIDYLNIVSHHFMARDELETPLGQERVQACAFRVPIGDGMVSMCEVNASGIRERFYETLRARV